jgi:hypothetical protein
MWSPFCSPAIVAECPTNVCGESEEAEGEETKRSEKRFHRYAKMRAMVRELAVQAGQFTGGEAEKKTSSCFVGSDRRREWEMNAESPSRD